MVKDKRKTVLAGVFSLLYIICSTGEILAVKALNYNRVPLKLPTYTAFLSNQLWLFMIPIYYNLLSANNNYVITRKLVIEYFGMGSLTFAISLLRNISVNIIPGSVFSLLLSTSILFNMILSYLWLKKSFNIWHLGAALCCVSSALSITLVPFITNQEATAVEANFTLGIPTAIGASFFIAFMSVWQEQVQPAWDDFNLRFAEMTIFSSLIASFYILIYSGINGELFQWSIRIISSTQTEKEKVIVICVSIILPVLKLLVRNTKYSTIKLVNAFFFEFVQASSALFGSLSNVLIFNEPWGVGYIISLILLMISFAMYSRAKIVAKKRSATLESGPRDLELVKNPIKIIKIKAWG